MPQPVLIGRRIENGDGHPAFNKLATASNQKVILTEFDLIVFLAQPNQATGPGNKTATACGFCGRLAIKNDCVTPVRVESVTISWGIAAAPTNSNRNAASPDKNASRPAANFSLRGLTTDVFSKLYFFTDLVGGVDVDPQTVLALPVGVFRHLQFFLNFVEDFPAPPFRRPASSEDYKIPRIRRR